MSGSIDCALYGALTKDAERRTSKGGKDYALLNVVCGKDDSTQFVSVFVFGDAVNNVGHLQKGSKVYIEGTVEVNTWQAQDGSTRAGLKVLSFKAEETHRIGHNKKKRSDTSTARHDKHAPLRDDLDDPLPF